MDDIDKHAAEHGYKIELTALNGSACYKLSGGKRTFGHRVRIFRAAPNKRCMPRVRRGLYDEACRLLKEFHGRVEKSSRLNDRQRVDVAKAYELLHASGRHVDLAEVTHFFLKYNPAEQDCTNSQAVLRFLKQRGVAKEEFENTSHGYRRDKERRQRRYEGYSRAHRLTLTSQLRKFTAEWGKEQIGVMAAKRSELKAWLEKNFTNKTTRSNYRRALHNFFGWAVEEGLIAENPARPWKLAKTSSDRAVESAFPEILTPQELAEYLRGAAAHAPKLLPYFVIGAFSGIRTSEFEFLRWENIGKEVIRTTPEIAKTGVRSEIPIHPTLAAWLKCLPVGEAGARVVPPTFEAMRRRLREKLNKDRAKKLAWPANALRHSFGSYRYRETGSLEKTSLEMRHLDPKVFRSNYLNPSVTKDMANEYWSLMPAKVLLPAKLPGKKTGRKRRR